MDIEEIDIDGQLITISLPVNNLKIDGKTVSYRDSDGDCEKSFSTPSIARKFMLMLAEF
jgi:hypothetical protein